MSLNAIDQAKTLPLKTSVKLSRKGDASIDSYLLSDVFMAPINAVWAKE